MTDSDRADAHPMTGNALEVIRLIKWARAEDLGVHQVTVGDVTLVVTDNRVPDVAKPQPDDENWTPTMPSPKDAYRAIEDQVFPPGVGGGSE